jgi:type IV pilus assembly protein PilW
LMVAITLAMVTTAVVLQVLVTYEARKRTTTVGTDAEIGASVGLFMLERELRMSGAGFTSPVGFACNAGVNLYFDGATIADGAALAPVRIIDGGAGPDSIRVLRSDAAFGIAPSTVVQSLPTPSAAVVVNSAAGLENGDLFLAGSPDGTKTCTLMQMSEDPQASGSGWSLVHDSGQSKYNPLDPDAVFTNAVRYDVGDVVTNLGRFGLRTFGVVCNDGAAPGPANTCNVVAYDTLVAPAPPTLADVESIAPQVVELQAQYGVAPAGSQTVDEWVDATAGTWGAPDAANQRRIKAVRLAIVTRGNLEREIVSPASIVLWDAGLPTERAIALADDERRYRYKVISLVVPLINVIWAAV